MATRKATHVVLIKRAKQVQSSVAGEITKVDDNEKSTTTWGNTTVTKRKSSGVDEYIARCPIEARGDLAKIRAAIRAAVPAATERTDYFQWPGYSHPGIDYYDGMFAWFSFKKPHIRLHVPLSVIKEHRKELAGFATTKAIVSFPLGKPVPIALVKKLVRASLKAMKDKNINRIKT